MACIIFNRFLYYHLIINKIIHDLEYLFLIFLSFDFFLINAIYQDHKFLYNAFT